MLEKGKKMFTKDNLLIVVLCGVLILIALWPVDKQKQISSVTEPGEEKLEQTEEKETYRIKMQEELAEMLRHMEGVGRVRVMITMKQQEKGKEQSSDGFWGTGKQTSPGEAKVEGILVLAQGAGNAKVREDITETAKALFDVEANKVKVAVLMMSEGER